MIRAAQIDDVDTVQALIASGTDVNIADRDGMTPLHHAANEGSNKVVAVLLKAGADFTLEDDEGDTPLILAVADGHVDVVHQLLLQGDDPDFENPITSETAMSMAQILRREKKINQDMVDLLVWYALNKALGHKIRREVLGQIQYYTKD